MKNAEINELEQENIRLVQRNSKLESTIGRMRANLMLIEFPREHQETVDKVFEAVERAITSM